MTEIKQMQDRKKNTDAQAIKTKNQWNKILPFIGLLDREIRRFCKVYFQTIITPLVNTILYLLIFGLSLGTNIDLDSSHSYLSFLIPGLMMMALLRNAFDNSTTTLVVGRYSNELQDLKTAPLNNDQILWAIGLSGVVRSLIIGIITLFIGELFQWIALGRFLSIAHPLLLFYFAFIGSLSFAFLGIYISMQGKNFEQINGISSFILQPLLYLGGIFFPISSLPSFWQTIAKFNPFLYLINASHYCVLGTADFSLQSSFFSSIAFFLLFYLLSKLTLQKKFKYRW